MTILDLQTHSTTFFSSSHLLLFCSFLFSTFLLFSSSLLLFFSSSPLLYFSSSLLLLPFISSSPLLLFSTSSSSFLLLYFCFSLSSPFSTLLYSFLPPLYSPFSYIIVPCRSYSYRRTSKQPAAQAKSNASPPPRVSTCRSDKDWNFSFCVWKYKPLIRPGSMSALYPEAFLVPFPGPMLSTT